MEESNRIVIVPRILSTSLLWIFIELLHVSLLMCNYKLIIALSKVFEALAHQHIELFYRGKCVQQLSFALE
jgi:hypothetical protein